MHPGTVLLMTLDTPTLESPPAPPDPRKSWSRTLLEWLGIIVAAVLVSLLVRTYVFQTYYVPSGSMEPTLRWATTSASQAQRHLRHDSSRRHRGF